MIIFEAIKDTVLDCLLMLPFLIVAFLMVEWIEHRAGQMFQNLMKKAGKAGPLAGSLLGCVPQCGFSVLSSNLYAAGLISMGTLLAVYLSTSDEAILILMTRPESLPVVGRLLLAKVILGLAAGFLVDRFVRPSTDKSIHEICTDCGCDEHDGILLPALRHTGKVFVFVFIVTLCLDLIMDMGGEDFLGTVLLTDSVWQPFLTALVGLIPNCAVSVLLTELLLSGTVSFGAAVSGLATGAGVGLLVLFRMNRSLRENLTILGLLYVCAVAGGLIIQLAAG